MGDFNCGGEPFPGFYYSSNYVNSGAINLAATVGAHSIPGPAVGFIRIIFHTALTPLGSTPAITAQLQPSGLFFGRALAPGGASAGSSTLFGTTQLWALGAGETMDITNTGTAACVLWYTYLDIPATNRTLIRTSFSNTPVDIIPAAAPGTYNKWLAALGGSTTAAVVKIVSLGFNDDTAAARVEDFLGGALIGRTASAAANTQVAATAVGGMDLVVTTEAYRMATEVAVTTRNVNFMGVYETFAGTP